MPKEDADGEGDDEGRVGTVSRAGDVPGTVSAGAVGKARLGCDGGIRVMAESGDSRRELVDSAGV